MNQFVLDAYAARSCPVKTFNAFDPVLRGPAQPLDESLRESFQGGSDFRRGVLDRIAATPGAVDLRGKAGGVELSQHVAFPDLLVLVHRHGAHASSQRQGADPAR